MNMKIKIGVYTPNEDELIFYEEVRSFDEVEEVVERAQRFLNIKSKEK